RSRRRTHRPFGQCRAARLGTGSHGACARSRPRGSLERVRDAGPPGGMWPRRQPGAGPRARIDAQVRPFGLVRAGGGLHPCRCLAADGPAIAISIGLSGGGVASTPTFVFLEPMVAAVDIFVVFASPALRQAYEEHLERRTELGSGKVEVLDLDRPLPFGLDAVRVVAGSAP